MPTPRIEINSEKMVLWKKMPINIATISRMTPMKRIPPRRLKLRFDIQAYTASASDVTAVRKNASARMTPAPAPRYKAMRGASDIPSKRVKRKSRNRFNPGVLMLKFRNIQQNMLKGYHMTLHTPQISQKAKPTSPNVLLRVFH